MEKNIRVELYGNNQCPYCRNSMQLLKEKGIPFQIHEVPFAPDGGLLKNATHVEMMERANGSHTVPQIFVDGKHIGGNDDFVAWVASSDFDKSLMEA